MNDNFFITLPSNACKNIFPSNTGGHFKTILAQPLHLDNNTWEVGLAEITYVANSWDNVREGENEVLLQIDEDEDAADVNKHFLSEHAAGKIPVICRKVLPPNYDNDDNALEVLLQIEGHPKGVQCVWYYN